MTDDIYFHPQFVLESPQFKKAYLDRVLPLAVEAIQKREDPHRKLLDTVQMGEQPIPLSTADDDHSVWGVATWEYIDPRIDFFNVYVKGLTNAYRFADPPGAYKLGDAPGTGRVVAQKTLKLNFWRPGDERTSRKRKKSTTESRTRLTTSGFFGKQGSLPQFLASHAGGRRVPAEPLFRSPSP